MSKLLRIKENELLLVTLSGGRYGARVTVRQQTSAIAKLTGCRPVDVSRLIGVSSLTLSGWLKRDRAPAAGVALLDLVLTMLHAPRARPVLHLWFAQNLRVWQSKPRVKWFKLPRKPVPNPQPIAV